MTGIRPAVPRDRASVEAVVQAAYARYLPRIGQKPGPMLDDYATLIAANRVYVIDTGSAIIAVLVLIPEAGTMLLDNIAVDPAAQGQGHGRGLLRFAEQAALAAGYRSIRLYTHEAMTENIALYSRVGFMETHRAEQNGFARVFMTKTLE